MRVIATAFVLCALTVQASAASQPDVVPLGLFLGSAPTVDAVVWGREGMFLFDTGGGITAISPALAKAMGCEPWGNITGFRMRGDRLDLPRCDKVDVEIGKATYTAPTAAVFDIMTLVPKGSPQVDGAVGLDIFAGQAITIEASSNHLIVETPASLRARTRHLFDQQIRIVRDAQGVALTVDLGVPTEKGVVWMEMDTGNDDPAIVLSKSTAPLLGVDPANPAPQPIHVELAPGIVLQGNAHVVDNLIMDGNIGVKFLKAWNITLDLKHGKAWLAPAGP